eukprot:1142655-Pelagomonas_calceolata.AAC.2
MLGSTFDVQWDVGKPIHIACSHKMRCPLIWSKAHCFSHRPPLGLVYISIDALCWAAPGNVLRSPGDAAVAKRCHLLHRLA